MRNRVVALAGDHINDVARMACDEAKRLDGAVEFEFNDVKVVAHPQSYWADVVDVWWARDRYKSLAARIKSIAENPEGR